MKKETTFKSFLIDRVARLSATLVLLMILCATQSVFASAFSKTYGGRLPDHTQSAIPTSDGGSITVGSTDSFGIGTDMWIVKTTASGVITWQKRYGGSGYDEANGVVQSSDGGYLIAGQTNSYGAGDFDAWLLKLDPTGAIVWQKTYGGPGVDILWSAQELPGGGFIVSGITNSFGNGGYDGWFVKIDGAGIVTFQAAYGGYSDDYFGSIQMTPDGGYITHGLTQSFGSSKQGWVVKLSSTGNIQWQKMYGDLSDESVQGLSLTPDGGYIASGFTNSFGAGGYDFFAMKLTSSGAVQWQYTYGGAQDEINGGGRYMPNDGSYMLLGGTTSFGAGVSDVALLKLDSSGIVLWQKSYGGNSNDSASSINYVAAEKRFLIGGTTKSFGAGDYDQWLMKISSKGIITKGCSIVANTNVVVQKASFSVNDTYATPKYTDARVAATRTIPSDTNAVVNTQCGNGN